MIRAFIAITVPDSVLRSCEEIMARLKGLNLQGRFARTQSIHLTLQFLGNIEDTQPLTQVRYLCGTSAREWRID